MHKTQVSFTGSMNENIRTRLSHTLEVAQIARTIARYLNINEDLVEAIALGHDVGHTPFGHVGEAFLNDIVSGKEDDLLEKFEIKPNVVNSIGFKHNFQSVRVLTEFEKGYSTHKGLNISYPVLEGILKHSKICYSDKKEEISIFYEGISDTNYFNIDQPFASTIEGQIVNLADEIAQVCHDIEDAIEANYDSKRLIMEALNKKIQEGSFEGIEGQPFFREGRDNEVDKKYFKEFISWVIGKIILDSVEMISKNMKEYQMTHQPDPSTREYYPITEDIATETILKGHTMFRFLKDDIQEQYIINNYRINRENGKNRFILRQIVKAYLTNPRQLDDRVLRRYAEYCELEEIISELEHLPDNNKNVRYIKNFEDCQKIILSDPIFFRVLFDYIGSMTDHYAVSEYRKLYLEDNSERVLL